MSGDFWRAAMSRLGRPTNAEPTSEGAIRVVQRAVQQRAQEYEEQQRRLEQEAAQRQEYLSAIGQRIVDIVNGYTDRYQYAELERVEDDFLRAYPNVSSADFRKAVNALLAAGILGETKSVEGFMGQRTTRLWALNA